MVLLLLELRGIPAKKIGTVGGELLKISTCGEVLAWPLPELHAAWYDSIARAMKSGMLRRAISVLDRRKG